MEKLLVTAKVHNQLAESQLVHQERQAYAPYIYALLQPINKDYVSKIERMETKDVGCPHMPEIPNESLAKVLKRCGKEYRFIGIARIGNFNRPGEIGGGIKQFPETFVILSVESDKIRAYTNHHIHNIPYLATKES